MQDLVFPIQHSSCPHHEHSSGDQASRHRLSCSCFGTGRKANAMLSKSVNIFNALGAKSIKRGINYPEQNAACRVSSSGLAFGMPELKEATRLARRRIVVPKQVVGLRSPGGKLAWALTTHTNFPLTESFSFLLLLQFETPLPSVISSEARMSLPPHRLRYSSCGRSSSPQSRARVFAYPRRRRWNSRQRELIPRSCLTAG